jgi:chitinase
MVDDPASSPYPVWSALATYVQDDRIVWQGNVYKAKWWTKGDVPNDPVHHGDKTPWTLIGPVLPGDKPKPEMVVPAGTFPDWAAATSYQKGDRVMLEGRVFEAKWWVQAESPEASRQGSTESAWLKLSNDEITKLLAAAASK